MLSYNQALDFIHGLNRFGTKLGLQNITKLLDILGNPHKGIKIIHVAGTNGKGSTCAMIDSILRSAGFKVGLYTSPYLEVFNERMRVNGENISDDDLARLTDKVHAAVMYMRENNLGSPTEFEVVTAIGFLYFKEQSVDFLVLEVGMGGRLDATNVVTPMVSVITPISLDHQQYLGNTLKDIAREKCGIIKPGIPVVTSPQEYEAMRVIEEVSNSLNCKLIKVSNEQARESCETVYYHLISDDEKGLVFDLKTQKNTFPGLKIQLIGRHQLDNAATAVAAIEVLNMQGIKIKSDAIYSGLRNARWPGRLELISENPTILIDGAHNIAGIKTLKEALNQYYSNRKKILVIGILEDKDYKDMLHDIVPVADIIITTAPNNPRALAACELADIIAELFGDSVIQMNAEDLDIGKKINSNTTIQVYAEEKIEDAAKLAKALADSEYMIVFAGSLYMIGYVRTLLR
ncbi:MAG: bifunctional folylpolyglutamate synthase/dihydrofolate synthase [Tepidanaerobacter acetatoxydans]|nr:bifunctional folylpolyglutamate synthase/dihydrofolate synthase [Tepidanaerobacter acetatoxydans]